MQRKKEFLNSFIEKIEIYPEAKENNQILKSIKFRVPVYFDGNTGGYISNHKA